MNASEVTRFFPIENGLGYGSARISVLFRPVQVKLPQSLLGFDAGTLVVRKISVSPFGEAARHVLSALSTCDVKLKVSASSDKVPKKNAERKEGGSMVWNVEQPCELPVHQRYSSALRIKLEESGALMSSKLGMAILWLRDIVDNEDTVIEVALFQVEDYGRLKQNYIPPDGKLDSWETSQGEVTRIGTVRLDLTFKPGISTAHRKGMDTSEPQQKRLLEEVDRRDSVGLQEQVGRHEEGFAVGGENTEVDQTGARDETQVDEHEADESDIEGSDGDGSGSGEGKGLVQKLKDWKEHEKELHRQHRGIMQTKPARTAEWIKDNVEETGQKVKNRFKMKSRQPDVETEV